MGLQSALGLLRRLRLGLDGCFRLQADTVLRTAVREVRELGGTVGIRLLLRLTLHTLAVGGLSLLTLGCRTVLMALLRRATLLARPTVPTLLPLLRAGLVRSRLATVRPGVTLGTVGALRARSTLGPVLPLWSVVSLGTIQSLGTPLPLRRTPLATLAVRPLRGLVPATLLGTGARCLAQVETPRTLRASPATSGAAITS
ncbi:hypothetical protein [Kocuria atrinae]|uniref:hypothetical protein n=1 Tax=Kocuria atrinae TaxID=592377 RepID=UPI002941BFEE|nr:hypothetical protein [Kocuria atrinae]